MTDIMSSTLKEPTQPHGDKLIEDERLYDIAFAFHRGHGGWIDYGADMVFHFHARDGSVTGTHIYRLPPGPIEAKPEENADG